MNPNQERETLLRQILKAQGLALSEERIRHHVAVLTLKLYFYRAILSVGRLLIAFGLSAAAATLFELPFWTGSFGFLMVYFLLKNNIGQPEQAHIRGLAIKTAADAIKEGTPDDSAASASQDAMMKEIMDKLMERAARETANDPEGPKA
jgi:hypothetical protein